MSEMKELQAEIQNSLDIAESYKDFKVESQKQYVGAAEALKIVKGKINELDSKRKEMTRPLDESKKKIMSFFNEPIDKLKEAEKLIKDALIAYDAINCSEAVQGLSKRTLWRMVITDISAIPREYLLPNEEMISRIGQASEGKAKIPGVSFVEEKVLASRSK